MKLWRRAWARSTALDVIYFTAEPDFTVIIMKKFTSSSKSTTKKSNSSMASAHQVAPRALMTCPIQVLIVPLPTICRRGVAVARDPSQKLAFAPQLAVVGVRLCVVHRGHHGAKGRSSCAVLGAVDRADAITKHMHWVPRIVWS